MKSFSFTTRQQQLQTCTNQVFDLVIIGGGITGAGIALDAITRGLTVALVEMQDFAEGTSSRSTKLVHGGLRYLKQFEVKEVAELGRERAIVYENGPHVTTPVWMLLPFYEGGTFGKFSTSAGLFIYDILAGVKSSERRYMLMKEETLAREPILKTEGLLGGGVYVEYRTDDARLTTEVAKAAVEHGAVLLNYMKATKISSANLAFTTVYLEDQLDNESYEIKGKKVVNAAGPWVDEVRGLDSTEKDFNKHLSLSKGVHLVFNQDRFPLQQAIYFDAEDGRMIFAIPREGKTYVGTTDTFYDGDAKGIHASKEDVLYLIDAIQFMFPTLQITLTDVESSWAGVRPLIYEEGKDPSEVSRKDEIWQEDNGLITIAGGKLTGYRKMAEKIVNLVCKQLEIEYNLKFRPCCTKKLPISGADLNGSAFFDRYVEKHKEIGVKLGLLENEAESIVRKYGTNCELVFQYVDAQIPSSQRSLHAEIIYAIHHECVMKPTDFFVRRTGMLYFAIDFVKENMQYAMDLMGEIFTWDDERKAVYWEEMNEAIVLAEGPFERA